MPAVSGPRHRPARLAALLAAGLALSGTVAGTARAQGTLPATVRDQVAALRADRAAAGTAARKLATPLRLAVKRARGDTALFQRMPRLRTGTRIPRDAAGRARVEIRAELSAGLLARIEGRGGQVLSAFADDDTVIAAVPVGALIGIATLEAVRAIHPAYPPLTRKLDTTEGDIAHRADALRMAFGVDGSGVKTCVMSDSYDNKGGATAQVAGGDLPGPGNPDGRIKPVDVIADLPSGGTDEGRAMLEIIFDLAPGSTLGFATAGASRAEYAANIAALRSAGCDVIVDDISFISESTFQDDVVAQAVEAASSAGALFFSAAGNSGSVRRGRAGTWRGDFAATAPPDAVGGIAPAHDFGSGAEFNVITDDGQFFVLQWSDPYGASANNYDLYMLDATGTSIVAASLFSQNGNDDPLEIIDSATDDDAGNQLVVVRSLFGQSRLLSLATFGGQLAIATPGAITGHPCAESILATAAVRAPTAPFSGGERVESFSSDGPCRIIYDAAGNPLTPGNVDATGGVIRRQPVIAAANGVSTSTGGFSRFFGTSAAAPHAAAIAALLLEIDPGLSRTALLADLWPSTALDIEAPGRDDNTGFGIFDALAAAERLAGASAVFPGADVGVVPVDKVSGTTPLTLLFDQVTTAGTVRLTTTASGPPAPGAAPGCDPPVYFEVAGTVATAGPIIACIDPQVVGCAVESPAVFRRDGDAWIPLPPAPPGDATCAASETLGVFAVFATAFTDEDIPVLPAWALLLLGAALAGAGSVRRSGGGARAP